MVRPTPKQDSAPRRPRNASTGAAVPPASAAGAPPESGATGLFRAVLSWDFGAVVARLAAGKGVIEGDLAHVPKTFTSAEVRGEGRGERCAGNQALNPPRPPITFLTFPSSLSSLSALRLHL
jgi:hypothetical protein